MPTAPTTTEETEEPEGVNRLLGMVVQEVSLVDRAANERQFLVVKRDEEMPKKSKLAKDDPAAPVTGDPASPPGDAPPATDAGAAGLTMQAQVKDELLAALTSAAEKLVTVANSVKDAAVSDQAIDPAVPESVLGEIGEVASMLQGIAAQYGGGATDETKAKPQPDPAVPAAAGAAAGSSPPGEEVAKAGKKMAKERLLRFHKAVDLLAGILKELTAENMRKAAGGAPVAKSVAVPTIELSKIAATMDELMVLAKAQATEIARLKKITGAPQSLPVDGPRGQVAAPKPVVWELDMNRPINPSTVKKGSSFFTNPTK